MGKLLYTVAIILVIIWVIAFIGLRISSLFIHTLLIAALFAVVLRFITGSKPA